MEILEGREALAKADLIPVGNYTLKILSVKDPFMKKYNKTGSVAKVEIIEAEDAENNVPEVIGRIFDFWLVGKNTRGLRLLLQHLELDEVPEGDTVNLAGTTFKGRITSWEKDGEYQNSVRPS